MKFEPLKKKKDFLKTLKSGKRIYTATVTLVYLDAQSPKVGVCVGKKYGKSVQRNRIKRLLREAFRSLSETISSPAFVLLIPKPAQEYLFSKFQRDLKSALLKVQTA